MREPVLRIIPDVVTVTAQRYPHKEALIFGSRVLTYRQLKEKINLVAEAIFRLHSSPHVVAVMLPNSPEFLFVYFGAMLAGHAVLNIAHNTHEKQLKYQLATVNPGFLITDKMRSSQLETMGLPSIRLITVDRLLKTKSTSIKLPQVTGEMNSTILFTSGTTAAPKGVVLKHKNVLAATKNITQFLGWSNMDTDIAVSQLSHSFGLGNIHCVFATGGKVVLFSDAIDLKKILGAIKKTRATTLSAAPITLKLLLTHFKREFSACDGMLRFIQTNHGKLDEQFAREVLATFKKTKFQYYYGLTEASRATFITLSDNPQKIGSVGRPSPNVKVKIIGGNHKELPPGKIGEICICGGMVVSGYWDNPELNKKRFRNGWFYTNDAGYLDEEGFLYFAGRKDDIINVSGEKVSPDEVEAVLRSHPDVDDAAVVGEPDKWLGEVVKAFVVLASGSEFSRSKLSEFCRMKLESYKWPRVYEVISEIPRTTNGKVQRHKLRIKNNHE